MATMITGQCIHCGVRPADPAADALSGGIEACFEAPDLEPQCVEFQEYQQRAVLQTGHRRAVDVVAGDRRRSLKDSRTLADRAAPAARPGIGTGS